MKNPRHQNLRFLSVSRVSLLLVLLLFISVQTGAQCWQWAVSAGGIDFENPAALALTPGGTIAIAGTYNGTLTLGNDVLTAVAGNDVFVALADTNGTILKGMGGTGSGIENMATGVTCDGLGNIFVTGDFTETIQFENDQLTSEGSTDIFVVKYDSTGTLLWTLRAGGPTEIHATDIAADLDGNCYITGYFYDSATFNTETIYATYALDVFTVKIDADGNTVWTASCGDSSTDEGHGIAVDHSGNVYITGRFQSSFVFNNNTYSSQGNYDVFLAKYDASGTPLWASTGGGSGNEIGNKIATDQSGNLISIVGEFDSYTIDFDNVSLQNQNLSAPRKDIFLVSYNSAGTVQWGFSSGSQEHDYVSDIVTDEFGTIFITGNFDNTIAFGNTTLSNVTGDIFQASFDPDGNPLTAVQPDFNNAGAVSNTIAVFRSRPVIAGSFVAGQAPPKMIFTNDTLVSNGSSDIFMVKTGPPCSQTTGIGRLDTDQTDFNIYPNPFEQVLTIEVGDATFLKRVNILALDGKVIYSTTFTGTQFQTDLSDLAAGMYMVHVTSDKGQVIKKIMIKR